MIHHLSISAHNPLRVAEVLAEILSGETFAFHPLAGGFIVICDDGHGTAIEIYPFGSEMKPGEESEAVRFAQAANPAEYTATHAAVSVSLDVPDILKIAEREGWRAVVCNRGASFQVIEFWIENRILLELLTQEMAKDYLESMTPKKWTH